MKPPTQYQLATLGISASLLCATPSLAEEPTNPPANIAPIESDELAERRASIPLIEARLADRQEQMKELADDMERLHQKIETRIDKIVDTLASYRDSNQSKTRVARTKSNVMEGLGKVIADYKRKRDQLLEEAKQPNSGITGEDAQADLKALNELANKRIDQLIILSKSFTDHKDYDKYKEGATYYGGWGHHGWAVPVRDKNPDFAQNRRETKQTDSQRRGMIDALKSSITQLEKRITLLEDLSQRESSNDQEREIYGKDLAVSKKTLEDRQSQLATMLGAWEPSGGEKAAMEDGGTTAPAREPKKISRNEAHDLELLIHEVAEDIDRDMDELFRKYDELKQRRAQIRNIEANLDARKQWLENYDAQHGSGS
ncbi:hypothetical protein [Sulfuriroseicoccus oceanibius]|uniref:Uncharacterized protein n=1 Tax=Sulfuriroseicoccus oceanibius TaxID=2707525 RepID=A0A6B3L5Q1_9BACT|nr:hypothetical protein [Sulfuriroseicoccus oceanibius]QQL45265.1 hypothetical protein G3M56_001360 [Sulfuriroseicoccus oceanibius]